MSFELRLTFSGLTALVPRREAGSQDEAEEWLVVMPDLRKETHLERGDRTFTIAPHQAVLVVKEAAVRKQETTKAARLRFRDPTSQPDDADSQLLFQLGRELVEMGSGSPGLTVRSGSGAGELPDVQRPDQLHDIKWVPPIDDCADGGVPFDGRHLDPSTLLPKSSLAAVARLDRGTLETRDVHRRVGGEPVPYLFRTGGGNQRFRQALADSYRLRVPVDGAEARLVVTDRAGNRRPLVVAPHDGGPTENGTPVVEVQVFNRELEEVLGFGVDPETPERGDTDFVIFYRLSAVWDGLDPDDLALPYRDGNGGGGSSKPCEPPVYPGIAS